MKFNMICIKFNQKILKKPKFWTFGVFMVFFNLKNLGFFQSHFPALAGAGAGDGGGSGKDMVIMCIYAAVKVR